MSYLTPFMLTLALLFAMQSFALHTSGGRAVKSESNYFSSLGRIQAAAVEMPRIQLLGSSITGRLPDRAQGFVGVANMGCDGGSAVDVLRAMDNGILPAAPLLVIEANTLYRALDKKETEISHAIRGKWFAAGLRIPSVAAYARPAAFLYSWLLAKRIGGYGGGADGPVLFVAGHPEVLGVQHITLADAEESLVEELSRILKRLARRGSTAILVWLPPARAGDGEVTQWAQALAARADVPWWNLASDAGADAVVLTDGLHMDAPSAAQTLRAILRAMKP